MQRIRILFTRGDGSQQTIVYPRGKAKKSVETFVPSIGVDQAFNLDFLTWCQPRKTGLPQNAVTAAAIRVAEVVERGYKNAALPKRLCRRITLVWTDRLRLGLKAA